MKNLDKRSKICDMRDINVGVVSDLTKNADKMTFYSIRDTVYPETGLDSISNKKLPAWITQTSSFSMNPLLFNQKVFSRNGLRFQDYVVETNVTTKSYSELMKQVLCPRGEKGPMESECTNKSTCTSSSFD
mmetsp:Transcript_8684/g.10692  ORF Transcript_8684/g.10692 Transcript_8684/m.10692 type:complete len:131 (+) Transcript_8684:146-538(+)